MLDEDEAREVRRLASLAHRAREVMDRLTRDLALSPPCGTASGGIVLDDQLAVEPAVVELRTALAQLPADFRQKLRVLAEIGRGTIAVTDWPQVTARYSVSSDDIVTRLAAGPDLHECLLRGLHKIGAMPAQGTA